MTSRSVPLPADLDARHELAAALRRLIELVGPQRLPQDRAIAAKVAAGSSLQFAPGPAAGSWIVRATGSIGTIVAGYHRQGLRRSLATFDGVGPLTGADLDRPTLITRLNSHFADAERLARIVLDGSSVIDQAGRTAAGSFLVNMATLFERFVESRVRAALEGRLVVQGQFRATLGTGNSIAIRPDLVFSYNGKPAYVADAKYKLTGDGYGREADYYQLLAYCSSLGLDEGLPIYCQHDSGDGGAAEGAVADAGVGAVLDERSLPARPRTSATNTRFLFAFGSPNTPSSLTATHTEVSMRTTTNSQNPIVSGATTTAGPTDSAQPPLLVAIPEAARILSVSRTTIYELIWHDQLAPVRIGRSVRIRHRDLETLVQDRVPAGPSDASAAPSVHCASGP